MSSAAPGRRKTLSRRAVLALVPGLVALHAAPAPRTPADLRPVLEDIRASKGMAKFVDKILKGADASVVPIEQESRIALTINPGVARRIGLTVPQSILVRADRVIE